MSISVRLDKQIEDEVRLWLKKRNSSLSQFAREAIIEKLRREQQKASPYELGKDLFGRCKSGRNDLSSKRREIIRDRLRAKHHH